MIPPQKKGVSTRIRNGQFFFLLLLLLLLLYFLSLSHDVPRRVRGAGLTADGAEPEGDIGLLADGLERSSLGEVRDGVGADKLAERARALGVHNLGYAKNEKKKIKKKKWLATQFHSSLS